MEERNYSFDLANQLYMIVAVAGITTKIFIGWLADRFGSKRVMFINLTLLAFFYNRAVYYLIQIEHGKDPELEIEPFNSSSAT